MSAHIVTHAHINAIVRWASVYSIAVTHGNPSTNWYVRNGEQSTTELLYAENVASVNHRYNEAEPVGAIRYKPNGLYRPIKIIKLCNSLEYQSCEHPDWDDSMAKRLLDEIRRVAITKLPGYEAAPWSI